MSSQQVQCSKEKACLYIHIKLAYSGRLFRDVSQVGYDVWTSVVTNMPLYAPPKLMTVEDMFSTCRTVQISFSHSPYCKKTSAHQHVVLSMYLSHPVELMGLSCASLHLLSGDRLISVVLLSVELMSPAFKCSSIAVTG